jgi:ligand-binding sensor domain-containing protein
VSRSRLSRSTIILLSLLGLLLAAAVFALAALAVSRAASQLRASPVGPRLRWSGLPAPAVTRPQWTSFTHAGPINDLAAADGLLWAATDGGLVVWDLRAGVEPPPSAKFLVEHGLGANRVNAVAVGADGHIWAATAGGVSRYDGRAWQTWRSGEALPAGEPLDVVVARDGIVWVATGDALAAFVGRRWRVFGSDGPLAPLPGGVRALAVGPDNRLWAAGDGLVAYNGRWEAVETEGGPGPEPISALAVGPDGALWAATEAGLSFLADGAWTSLGLPGGAGEGETWTATAMAATAGGVLLGRSEGEAPLLEVDRSGSVSAAATPDGRIAPSALLVDESGGLWIGAGDRVYRQAADGWVSLATPSELPAADIHALLSHDGLLLAATEGGLAQIDGRRAVPATAGGLSAEPVRALDADAGALWAAFASPRDGLAFHTEAGWQALECATNGPPGRDVRDLALDGNGGVWLASDGGIAHFDGRDWRRFTPRDGLPDLAGTSVVVDDRGAVWAGTAGGLARFDGERWQAVDPRPIDDLALGIDGTLWALSDGRVGRVEADRLALLPPVPIRTTIRGVAANDQGPWLATSDGVAHFTGAGWQLLTTESGLPSNDVTAVVADGAGAIWAATSDDAGSIDIVTYDGGRWQPHPAREPAAERLLSNIVRDVLVAPDGNIWLATAGGVNRFYDGGQRAYTDADGLLGRDVRRLAYAYGSVWAATEAGLARFNGSTWTPAPAFSTGAHGPTLSGVTAMVVAPDGELWVGLDDPQQNALRVFDGRVWRVEPLLSEATEVRRLAFLPAAGDLPPRLVALVSEGGQEWVGLYDGRAWVWEAASALSIRIDQIATPDGRLWASGMLDGENGARPGIAVFEPGAEGMGTPVAVFAEPDGVSGGPDFALGGATAPFALQAGEARRVLFGGAGKVFAFPAGATGSLQPEGVIDLPLSFSRHTFALAVDGDGRLWAGTERGAAVLGPEESATQSLYAPAVSPAWWGSARSLTPRDDGSLLLGTASGGIGLYTGRGYDGVMRPAQGPTTWATARYPISDVVLEEDGTLWVASEGGGLASFDGSNWQVYAPDPVLTSPTQGLAVSGDEAWLATEAGLVRLVGLASGRCIVSAADAQWPARALLEDPAGDIWVGTAEDGLLRLPSPDRAPETNWSGSDIPALSLGPGGELWLANARQNWLTWRGSPNGDGEDGRWERLPLDLSVVRPEAINALAVTPSRAVWLGTADGAVVYDGVWTRLTTADGLSDNRVTALLTASDGTVWLATDGGLSRFRQGASQSSGGAP